MITQAELDNWFMYHKPTADQPRKYEAIRAKAKELAELILKECPSCEDTSAAIRHLREAVMTANAAIACDDGEEGTGVDLQKEMERMLQEYRACANWRLLNVPPDGGTTASGVPKVEYIDGKGDTVRGAPINQTCSICGCPQIMTTSGVTCQNGHGGAPGFGSELLEKP